MTRVLVDLLFFTGTKGGMESYVRKVYARMPSSIEYVGLASRELAAMDTSWFPGRIVDSGISGESRVAWAAGELTRVSRVARATRSDLIHAPANVGPWHGRVPVVLNLHDVLPLRHPEWVPGRYGPALRLLLRGAARHAHRIMTISESSKQDIVEFLHIDADRIDVTPLAGPLVAVADRAERKSDLLFALGNRMPHKNFERLLRGLAAMSPNRRPRLFISGSHGNDPLRKVVDDLGLGASVTLLGWLTDDEIETLYATATAVVIPSLFEGFGLPVIEAMAHGCPVACSDIPVLREVAGDSAAFFDPLDPQSIAATLARIVADPSLRARLSIEGTERARRYSWEETARLTAQTFERALERASS